MQLRSQRKAFTLIEVLASLLLMALAVTGILQGQSGSVRSVVRSEAMSQALALAEEKMTEIEIELQNRNFEVLPEQESGEYQDEQLRAFTWERRLERVDLGCFIPSRDTTSTEQQGFFALAQNIFERSIRKIVVEVTWTEGTRPLSTVLTQLYVRFEDIPDAF